MFPILALIPGNGGQLAQPYEPSVYLNSPSQYLLHQLNTAEQAFPNDSLVFGPPLVPLGAPRGQLFPQAIIPLDVDLFGPIESPYLSGGYSAMAEEPQTTKGRAGIP